MLRSLLSLALCFILCASCEHKAKTPSSVIFDGMMDLNDLYTLYLLSRSPQANLIGVTVCSSDANYLDQAGTRAKSILSLAKKPTIPVANLPSSTFCSSSILPENWAHPVENFADFNLEPSASAPLNISGSELMYNLLTTSTSKVTLFCCGSLNNVANVISSHPSLSSKIEKIVFLAGSLHSTEAITLPSNPHWEQASSYNVYLDPCAAQIVLASGIPITLIPLSVVTFTENNQLIFNQYAPTADNPGASFVLNALKSHFNSNYILGFCTFWDAIGMMSIIEPKALSIKKAFVNILTEGLHDFGHIIETPEGYPVDLCISVDSDFFYKTLFNMINK
jgi:inosine-uridine nucleoside N-ribohydrolase